MMMNDMKYAVFSTNWQPRMLKYNWVNWQWAGYTDLVSAADVTPTDRWLNV